MDKFISLDEAVSKINDGMTLMIGGFLGVGSALRVIDKIVEKGIKDLTIISNDTSFPDKGLGKLFANKQVKKVITSYIGSNNLSIDQMNAGEITIEFNPQGTLAERVRAGGAGLGGILTPTGIGTIAENGKEKISVNGKEYLLETQLRADVALIGATIADKSGNLVYKGTTQNFNPLMATAADVVIVEAQEIVETGSLSPETIHTQSIFVDYIVKS